MLSFQSRDKSSHLLKLLSGELVEVLLDRFRICRHGNHPGGLNLGLHCKAIAQLPHGSLTQLCSFTSHAEPEIHLLKSR